MGVDANLYLPGNVRVRTLTDVVARLLDAPTEKKDLDSKSHPGAWYAHTPEDVVIFESLSVPSMIDVTIKYIDPKITGQKAFGFGYHFEFGGNDNGACRGLILRSHACNIVLLKRLADFFGGFVDFQDCDSVDIDYSVKFKKDKLNCPQDGDEWQDLQERIMAVQPITQDELDDAERHAAYKEDKTDREARLKAKRAVRKQRYKLVNEDGISFWAYDTQTKRRMRPTNGEDAWRSEEVARDHVARLNRENQ